MFQIFFAGNETKVEVSQNARTAHGTKMSALRFGYDCYLSEGYDAITMENLSQTHTRVGVTHLTDLEAIFEAYQGEFCSNFHRTMVKMAHATHTSMSVGDVLRNTETGELFFCDSCGWTLLGKF